MAIIKSVNRKHLGDAAPKPKDPNILIYDVEDVETFPSVDEKGVKTTNDLVLKTGTKGIGVYVTEDTLSRNDAIEGDPPSQRFIHNVSGTAPGDTLALNEIVKNYINRPLIIITKGCMSDKLTRLHGLPCAPLYMTSEETDNNEATNKALSFAQRNGLEYKSFHYSGTIPPIEEYATDDEPAVGGM